MIGQDRRDAGGQVLATARRSREHTARAGRDDAREDHRQGGERDVGGVPPREVRPAARGA